jgi:hypothetical protein
VTGYERKANSRIEQEKDGRTDVQGIGHAFEAHCHPSSDVRDGRERKGDVVK